MLCSFGFAFKTEDVGGNPVMVGSGAALVRQKEQLNRSTWQADPDQLDRWEFDAADNGSLLEIGARFLGETAAGAACHWPEKDDRIRIHKSVAHRIRCGATMLMNSREVITLVFFQNLGKCR